MGIPFIYPLFLILLFSLALLGLVGAALPTSTSRSVVVVSLCAWLGATIFMTVRPGTGLGVRLNLIPFVVDGPGSAADAFRNFFVFVPAGMLLALIGWRILAALAGALAVSLAIEVTQYVTNLGRTADVNDLITNVAGAALGWLVAWSIQRAVLRRGARRLPAAETS